MPTALDGMDVLDPQHALRVIIATEPGVGQLPDQTESTPQTPAERLPRGREVRWTRARWFTAEYLIVVVGILTAMLLQAWWQHRGNRAQEQVYLHQLRADLAETQRLVSAADSVYGPTTLASARILRSFYLPRRPPRDSAAAWLTRALGFDEPRPVVGTAEALVATGDLALLRDPEIRSAVTRYLESSRQLTLVQHNYGEEWRRGHAILRSRVDLLEIRSATRTQQAIDSAARVDPRAILPAGARRQPFPLHVDSLLSDRPVYEGLSAIHPGSMGMAGIRRQMLASAAVLQAQIDDAVRGRTKGAP